MTRKPAWHKAFSKNQGNKMATNALENPIFTPILPVFALSSKMKKSLETRLVQGFFSGGDGEIRTHVPVKAT